MEIPIDSEVTRFTCNLFANITDKMQIVDKNENKKEVISFDVNDDIYDIISYFLQTKNSDDPFYIVDLSEIQRKYLQWIKHLPKIQVFYAVKSNPDPMILHVLANLGSNFDCASREEIILALSMGIDSSRIIYANPTKDQSSLQFARSQDVDYLTFDSVCELDKIKINHPDSQCIIRIKVDDSGSECQFSSKFGCSLLEAKDLLNLAKLCEINIIGVSFHVGSNCHTLGYFNKALQDSRKLADIAIELGFDIKIIDIGGGFPGVDDKTASFENLANEINLAIYTYFTDLPNIKFIAEPGRFFSTSSHTLISTIIGIKSFIDTNTSEKIYKYTINEGVYGSFNCIIFDHAKPIILPFNERTEKTYKSTIFGCSCDSIDVITKEAYLPKLAVGDRVFVSNFGAYTRASSSSFNGFHTSLIHYIIKN
jgi:diaminopimelate decarboxylase